MRANLTISLAIGLAIHVAKEVCETADLDVVAGRSLGAGAQLAARNLRDLVCGMPKGERALIIGTVREYTQHYLRSRFTHSVVTRRAARIRIFDAFRHAKSIAQSHA